MTYHQIESGIYEDPDIRHWSHHTLGLYMWLFTNSATHGLTGLYRAPTRDQQLAGPRLTPEELDEAWSQIRDTTPAKVVEWNDSLTKAKWLWIVGKGNRIFSATQHIGAVKKLIEVPVPLARMFLEKYRSRLQNSGPFTKIVLSASNIACTYLPPGKKHVKTITLLGGADAKRAPAAVPAVKPGKPGDPV